MPIYRPADFSYSLETYPTPSGAPKGVSLSKDDMRAEQLRFWNDDITMWRYRQDNMLSQICQC